MTAAKRLALAAAPPQPDADQRVQLHGVSWAVFLDLLARRGDASVPRMTYSNGTLELMSPSENHETIARNLDFLLGTYCVAKGIVCRARGSWTLKSGRAHKATEPDNCYILGPARASKPQLAIEVIWTNTGVDKLAIYHALGVREVWQWQRGKLTALTRIGDGYETIARSALLPDIELAHLARCAMLPSFNEALAAFLRRSAPRK